MNELINKDNEWIIHFMGSLDRLLDNVEHLTANYRLTLPLPSKPYATFASDIGNEWLTEWTSTIP